MIDVDRCKLIFYPADVLMQRADEVTVFDETLRALVEKMKDIMATHKGIGLAAPQVGVSLRVFVASLEGTSQDAKVYINPKLTLSGPMETNEEGCLSFPGMYVKVRRNQDCQITAQDVEGREFTENAEGLLSRCLQHEYDHLEGILLTHRMSQAARIVHRRQLKKLEDQYRSALAE